MTIDEAIEHAKEVARTCDDVECAAEHMQLAEWLRQARGATKAARWYTARISEIEDENAKLRSMVTAVLVLIHEDIYEWLDATMDNIFGKGFTEQARELGIEVE